MPLSRWSRAALLLASVLAAAGLADSALAAASPPFTWQADLATALGIAGVVGIGAARILSLRRRERRPGADTRIPRSAVVWWASIGASAVSFEVLNYFLSPRRQHPTVSSLVAALTSHDVLRGLLFVVWLAAGCYLWGEL